jgi:hypothetical protein
MVNLMILIDLKENLTFDICVLNKKKAENAQSIVECDNSYVGNKSDSTWIIFRSRARFSGLKSI